MVIGKNTSECILSINVISEVPCSAFLPLIMNSAVNIILYIAIQFFLCSKESIGIRKATNLLEVNHLYIGHIDQDMYYYVRLS